jgi:hypothetical protein
MSDSSSSIALAIAIARVTLFERVRRRKLMSGILIAILVLFGLGNWPLDRWLSSSIWLMILWWGACMALCFFLVMLGLYDALAVIREEREKLSLNKGLEEIDEE